MITSTLIYFSGSRKQRSHDVQDSERGNGEHLPFERSIDCGRENWKILGPIEENGNQLT